MNTPSGNDPSSQAKQMLAAACRAIDRASRLRWVMLIGQMLLLSLLALLLADYWLILPVWLRAVGALGLLVLLGFGCVGFVRFFLRPTRLKQGALAIEAQQPDLGCEVSTTAEYLSGERKINHEYELELAAALEAKTAKMLAASSPSVGPRFAKFAMFLAVTFVVLLILVLLAPGGLTALERTAVPFSKAHYTFVEVKPGDFEIPVGHNAELTNSFSGRLPKDARISWAQKDSAKWQTVSLTNGTQGTYRYTLTNLQSDLVYRVAGNDALSPDYKITTYVPPTVEDFNVHLKFPEYTKLAVAVQRSPNISVVRATTAEIQIQPSVPLKQANLRSSKSSDLHFSPNADGSWSASVSIASDMDYFIELADTKGHSGVNEQPYHIKALPDNPPKVEISEPGKDTRSSSTNKLLVKISVSDDFGVGKIKLFYNKLGGDQQTIEATREFEHNNEVIAKAELDLSSLDLKEYELVAYHAEATDNNTLDGPGIGKSPVYFVEITDEQADQSLSQGQAQKLNLLVIQKQIVADTTAMPPDASTDKFKEMSSRQSDAAELGRMYQEAISGGGAEAAVNEMHAALTEMQLSGAQLDKQQRAGAIPHEESALAHLYQVVKLMPELGNMPTTPPGTNQPPPSPKVQVVLEAIKQKKKEQPDNKELQDALDKAKDLARAQSGLNTAMRHPSQGSGKGQGQQMANQNNPQSQSKNQAQGEGAGQGKANQADQKDQKSDSQDQKEAETNPPPGTGDAPAQIAQKEDQLSKEAVALADLLQKLAGSDKRLGHNLGTGANRAATKMTAAAKAMTAGNSSAAGDHGFQGELAMRNVVDQLERLLKNQPEPTDIAHEDAPKEYDGLISDYLKKLSHAE